MANIKIGDKVRVVNHHLFSNLNGKEATVLEIRPPERRYKYYIRFPNYDYPVLEDELEKIYAIGQQLLLFEV